jgi:DNA-binding HxlR family transcriptional regulator
VNHGPDPALAHGQDERVWDRGAWNLDPDSVALALRVMSPRTAGMIMREAFYGTRRFEDFLRHVHVSSGVLAARLRELVEEGILEKRPYREPGARVREEYHLTDKGRSMLPLLVALIDWADRWLVGPQGPTVRLLHRDCGAAVTASVRCARGHSISAPRDVIATPGPGAQPAVPAED